MQMFKVCTHLTGLRRSITVLKKLQGPISQRDLSPDLDIGLKFCQQNIKSVVLDLVDFTKLSP